MRTYRYLRLTTSLFLTLLFTASTSLASCPAPLTEDGASCVHQPWTSDNDLQIGSIGATSPYAGSLPLFYIDKSSPDMNSQTLLAGSDALALFEDEPIFESTALSVIYPVDRQMLLEGVEFVVISSSDCLKENFNPAEPCSAIGGQPRAPFGGDFIFKFYELHQNGDMQWVQELTQYTETFALSTNNFQPVLNQDNPYELITRSLTLNLTAKNIILEPGKKYFASIQHVTIKKLDDGSGKADKIIYAPSTVAQSVTDWWLYDYDNTRDLTAMNLNDLDTLFAEFTPANSQKNNLVLPLIGQQAMRYSVSTVTTSSGSSQIISTCEQLQNLSISTSSNVTLGRDIDCSNILNFEPIQIDGPIVFNGNSKTIHGVSINKMGESNVGLFRSLPGESSITNVELSNFNIIGGYKTGALAGSAANEVQIQNVTVGTNSIIKGTKSVGGLIGELKSKSFISNSSSRALVVGSSHQIGGLVGLLYDSEVIGSSSSGTVQGSAGYTSYIGGIAGRAERSSNLEQSYSTAEVIGHSRLGGLIGGTYMRVSIVNSYATGDVRSYTSGEYVGGLVGILYYYSNIYNSYSTGKIAGATYIGGISGFTQQYSSIQNSFTTAIVDGVNDVGHVVGRGVLYSLFRNVEYTTSGSSAPGCLGTYDSSTQPRVYSCLQVGTNDLYGTLPLSWDASIWTLDAVSGLPRLNH